MSERKGRELVQRMRMARRVADTLLPLEGDVMVTAASTADVVAGQADPPPLKADFVITALDLMMQLSLLVGNGKESLNDPATLEAANVLLWSYPQSAACVLVADDEPLTSRIVEWGDSVVGEAFSAVRSSFSKQGPLREIVMAYLSTIDLHWPEPSSVVLSHELAFDEVASQSAHDALIERQSARRSPIPERAQARASLDVEDAQWAARTALAIADNEHVDLKSQIDPASTAMGDHS